MNELQALGGQKKSTMGRRNLILTSIRSKDWVLNVSSCHWKPGARVYPARKIAKEGQWEEKRAKVARTLGAAMEFGRESAMREGEEGEKKRKSYSISGVLALVPPEFEQFHLRPVRIVWEYLCHWVRRNELKTVSLATQVFDLNIDLFQNTSGFLSIQRREREKERGRREKRKRRSFLCSLRLGDWNFDSFTPGLLYLKKESERDKNKKVKRRRQASQSSSGETG